MKKAIGSIFDSVTFSAELFKKLSAVILMTFSGGVWCGLRGN